jgi:Flp pilus assembly protein TadD
MEAFQDRGADFDRVRDFTQNTEARILFVTGPRGIGKTDFLNAVFQKNLRDWTPIRVPIAPGTRVARVLADIAYRLGITLDIDSLAAATHNVFRQKVRKVLGAFFDQPRRALILDDLHDVLRDGTARDYRHLETFLEEARSPVKFVGGRVIIVSSTWMKSQWVHASGVSHLPLKELQDIYIRRVMEYQLRLSGSVRGEAPPSIPQQLQDIVRGHPLSARLLVDAAAGRELNELAADLENITEHIASELLRHVQLTPDQTSALKILSVFRLPVRGDLLPYDQLGINRPALEDLAHRTVLIYDGSLFSMHEAVRRFFYAKLSEDLRKNYHRIAAGYYGSESGELDKQGFKNPGTAAELAHHAALSGDTALTARLRTLVVEELKPAARRIYREDRDYARALKLYRTIADVVPDDADVIAYLGRCHARLGSWDESDAAFDRAAHVAARHKDEWWIYRDWGHIRARYRFYVKALECFRLAEDRRGKEPSISAALAYMHWMQGDTEVACELFQEALYMNPNHTYALTYYARLLDELGEYSRAAGFRDRAATIERWDAPLVEHDLDVETDDL